MGPKRIIIVRHSERFDQVNPSMRTFLPRPNDSPLSANGHSLARQLGSYLLDTEIMKASCSQFKLSDIVILSSPLIRCIQTAHGIVEGLLQLNIDYLNVTPENILDFFKTFNKPLIPIFIEPGVIEGAYWQSYDISEAVNCGNVVINLEAHAMRRTLSLHQKENHKKQNLIINQDYVHENFPVWMHPLYLANYVSPLVQLKKFPNKNKEGFSEVNMKWLPKEKKIIGQVDTDNRLSETAKAIASSQELDGKTVIVVAHGETVVLFYNALSSKNKIEFVSSPPYTGWAELVFDDDGWIDVSTKEGFNCPHLEKGHILYK